MNNNYNIKLLDRYHQTYKRNGIAKRLLIRILFFSSVATMLMTSLQLYIEYENDLNDFDQQFVQIESVLKDSVTQSYWTFNDALMDLQLEGILNFPGVKYVAIITQDGSIFKSAGEMIPENRSMSHRYDLLYRDSHVPKKVIGTLMVVATKEVIHTRLFDRLTTILLSQAIKTFLVASFILWIVHRLLTRHLGRIDSHIQVINPDANETVPASPLKLDRLPIDDELEQLVSSLNQAHSQITNGYSLLRQREQSLAQAVELQEIAEKQATYEKARALTTLSIIDDAIIVTDHQGNITLVNASAYHLFGLTSDELLGKSASFLESYLWQHRERLDLLATAKATDNRYVEAQCYLPEGNRKTPVSITIRPIFPTDNDTAGLANCVIILCDLSQEQVTSKMLYLSTHDFLTSLPNRYSFDQALKAIPEQMERFSYVALGVFDLDNFKIINDTCGHAAGDALLSQLASCLSAILPKDTDLYRLGGDEFGLLIRTQSLHDINRIANLCLSNVREYEFIWEHARYQVTTSLGVSILNRDQMNPRNLLIEADEACYRAKAKGGNVMIIQYAEDAARHAGEMYSLHKVQMALQHARLQLFAQPIMPMDNSRHLPPRLEMLVRYQGEDGQLHTPAELIDVSERYGMIAAVDLWVIEEMFRHAVVLINSGWFVNVNVSPQSLVNERVLQLIEYYMDRYQFPPNSICLEITERSIVSNVSHTKSSMQRLHLAGVQFALDDFGTGFASYGFIGQLPISMIKIDGNLIQQMEGDQQVREMIASIASMSRTLQANVAAEFVIDQSTLDILGGMSVDYMQGEYSGLAAPVQSYFNVRPYELEPA